MEKIFIIAAGFIALYFSGRLLIDPSFTNRYVMESPKAFIWRKMFGPEKALKMTKYFFAPIGLLLSIALIALGLMK